jgi:EpsI family protein
MRVVLISLLLGAISVAGCGQNSSPPDFNRIPRRLGLWEVKSESPLSPDLLAAVGADIVVDRYYRYSRDERIQVGSHLAVFSDFEKGMLHNPMKVYKATGWKLLAQNHETVPTTCGNNIQVSLSEWEKGYETVLVLYWYQLGDRILLDKSELDQLRSELGDQEPLDRLVKVQLQLTKTHPKGDDELVKELAGKIAKWIEKPFYHE